MIVLATILIALGLACSLAALVHDFRRARISREHGAQLAPSRAAPEVHAIAAALVGTGIGLIWGRSAGWSSGVGYTLLVYLVLRPLAGR